MGVSQKEKALDICDLSTYWKRLEVKVRELRTERASWLAHYMFRRTAGKKQ